MPKANNTMVRLSPKGSWDFNTCVVRDPRYPIALPLNLVLWPLFRAQSNV